MSSQLFTPYRMRDLEIPNRIVVSPMCQYSADNGSMTDWHMMHIGALTNSGAGLFIIEATAVEPEGRIGHGCVGLYSDDNEKAMQRVVDACRRFGTAKIGIQIGHAGRKASCKRPWDSKGPSDPLDANAWQTKSASPLAYDKGWHTPAEMTLDDIAVLRRKFVEATKRAERIGLDLIELHGAHGYLLHEFLSPLSNKRTDRYGGSLENRMRIVLELFQDVRATWPAGKPLGVRISATDWVDGGWDVASSVALSKALKDLGCDYICASSGGNDPGQKIILGPGYQVPFSEAVHKEVGIPTMAVGLITEPEQAEAILTDGKADMIALARGFLDDPHWGWHAAIRLGAEVAMPPQYQRVGIKAWPAARRHGGKAA